MGYIPRCRSPFSRNERESSKKINTGPNTLLLGNNILHTFRAKPQSPQTNPAKDDEARLKPEGASAQLLVLLAPHL